MYLTCDFNNEPGITDFNIFTWPTLIVSQLDMYFGFNLDVQADTNVHSRVCTFYINNASGARAAEAFYSFKYQYD